MKLRLSSGGYETRPAKRSPPEPAASLATVAATKPAKRGWYRGLCRRSQRKRLTWERFADLLEQLPLPLQDAATVCGRNCEFAF